jgi:plastocyanin
MRVRFFVAIAIVIAACGGSDSTNPPASTNKSWDVYTLSTAFSPNSLTISAGDTVRFNIVPSANGEGHDVTFNTTPAGAPPNIKVTLRDTIALVFKTRGAFHYECFVHPGMNGDVIVH